MHGCKLQVIFVRAGYRDSRWWLLLLLLLSYCGGAVAQAQSCRITNSTNVGTSNFIPYTVSMNAAVTGVGLLTNGSTVIGYVDENGVSRNALPSGNRWTTGTTSAANASMTLTFATPIPASWIAFYISDLGHSTGGAYSPNMQLTLSGVGNTATAADFSMRNMLSEGALFNTLLSYEPTTGAIRKTRSGNGTVRESGVLVGNSSALVKTLTFNGRGFRTNDNVVFFLTAIPTCVSVDKVTTDAVGSFDFAVTNLSNSGGTSVSAASVTTTTAGTAASSGPFYVLNSDAAVTLDESVDVANWELTSAVCTDANGDVSGNNGQFGILTGTVLSIPTLNLVPNADIHCTFNNRGRSRDLQMVKTASTANAVINEVVTYSLVASNKGPDDAANVVVSDTPDAGLDCSSPSSTASCQASGGASCPGPTVTVSDLTGAGITIASFPAQGQVTISLQCTVTASGSP